MTVEINVNDKSEKIYKVGTIFTPSTPINIQELFSGRYKELEKAKEVIIEAGAHLIIYGDRGVGKTSLTNILKLIVKGTIEKPTNIGCTYIACNPYEEFKDIWEKSLNQITQNIEIKKEGNIGYIKDQKNNEIQAVPLGEIIKAKNPNGIGITEVVNFISEYNNMFVFIFDEFDRIENKKTKEKFSFLIKSLSDTNSKVTIILVGIAENISTIIEEHKSVERCLKQIHIPRMSKNELEEIINTGLKHLEMKCEETTKTKIINFAEGFPQYIHLLCKHSAVEAIKRNSNIIEEKDLKASIEKSIDEVQGSIKANYRLAVKITGQKSIFKAVLQACAFAETDEYGNFTSKDIESILGNILTRNITVKQYGYHLGKLCSKERGKILQRIDTRNQYRFKFINPLLKAFVKIKAYQEGLEIH